VRVPKVHVCFHGKSFDISYDALLGFAPSARASPNCDGAVLPESIAEKFPEQVM